MSDLEGAILSDYYLVQCISKGGVADVYRARQNTEGNFEVAVKIYRPGYAQRSAFREYFMEEAERIGQFDHANILPFLEFGEGEGLLYVVTPYVETGTLEGLLKRVGGKLSAMQALPIIEQLCSAIQYAHDHDVIHGNLKPSNVFVATDGRMLLADFGIARGFDDSQQSLTRMGWGSAEYASPEQSLGVLRRSSDIYSLGVLLFRILTGQPPFTGQTPVEVLLKHVRLPSPSARSIAPNISDAVDGVLRMAMQKRADDRFSSAKEFSNAYMAAVTVAPTASPVARSVAPMASQTVNNQLPNYTQKLPTPTFNAIPDPHTPFPASIALTPPAVSPLPKELSPLQNKIETGNNSGSDITDKRKKNFLEEDDSDDHALFWSSEPVEWSPIADSQAVPVPPTPGEYLHQKPVVQNVPGKVSPTSPKPSDEKEKQSIRTQLNKVLPIVVVILLILGLIGALLSSFLFSSQGHTPKTGYSYSIQEPVLKPAVIPVN